MKSKSLQLSKEEVAEEITKREEAFEQAEPAERRVLVAKDVIDQLESGRIHAVTGLFVRAKVRGGA